MTILQTFGNAFDTAESPRIHQEPQGNPYHETIGPRATRRDSQGTHRFQEIRPSNEIISLHDIADIAGLYRLYNIIHDMIHDMMDMDATK